MERKIIITEDGSHSMVVPQLNTTYHSVHGAIQESRHVFINAGLNYFLTNITHEELNVFEMGFGTGLNSFLTAIEATSLKIKIHYTTIEQFPITVEEAWQLNYPGVLGHADLFEAIHKSKWNEQVGINEYFTLNKIHANILNFSTLQHFNLVYYDAFDPKAQPELWTGEIFENLFRMLQLNGVVVTYCCKGDVRRAMTTAGFTVKKLPGPPGKREIVRAVKSTQAPTDIPTLVVL